MITLFLRFPDELTALSAFAGVTGHTVEGLSDVPSKVEVNGLLCDVDPIGPLTDGDGVAVAGWHVNIWVPDDAIVPPALEPARVHPVTPARVFG